MVVLAAAICTKNGKPLLSRQFSEMTKSRVEGLLSAFPKLIGNGKQHTFIETENIRYVYQPLESLYLVLITNKNSNILEDIETLHLLAKLVPEYSSFDEQSVSKKAFDIIFTFDEVIAMGYKERVTVQQIKHFISMESHEEERVRIEKLMKEKEAKIEANKKIKDIEKLKMGGMGGSMGGMGGGGGHYGGMGSGGMSPSSYGSGGYRGDSDRDSNHSSPLINERERRDTTPKPAAAPMKEGMKLGMKSTKKSAIAQVLKEEKVVEKEEELEALLETNAPGGAVGSFEKAVPTEAVHIVIEEQILAIVENDGTVESIDIKGGLSINISNSNLGAVKVALKKGPTANQFQFITHPNIDKQTFSSSNALRTKDGKGFPSGGILKWRCRPTDDSLLPIKVNCWPSTSGGVTTVNLEYEAISCFPLKNVLITIPNPSGNQPTINNFDGLYEYSHKDKQVLWKIPLIDDSNSQGSMEFTVKGNHPSFSPVKIHFTSPKTICQVDIIDAVIEETDLPTPYSSEVTLSTDNYEII